MLPEDPGRPHFRITWEIPIWVVAGFLSQAVAIGWWAAGVDGRVKALEARADQMNTVPPALARLDERTRQLSDSLTRIEARLDQPERGR
ncbi:hypothetical protein ACO2Q3_21010 [Caulobacter sp. KR2-114]|uniref:hypothetical protein n=1 Tax=Caulobacter sp. KR2-114 TaxID=3400912 RepID=UPI003C0C33EE